MAILSDVDIKKYLDEEKIEIYEKEKKEDEEKMKKLSEEKYNINYGIIR